MLNARRVNPIYYVFFTTATIIASAILFQGFNTPGGVNTVSLICGFLVIFMGVFLLNISREPDAPHHPSSLESGLMSAYDRNPLAIMLKHCVDPRMSMSGRLSLDSNGPTTWNYSSVPGASYAPDGSLRSASHGRRSSIYRAQNSTLFSAFEEEGVALSDLPEEDESDEDGRPTGGRTLLRKANDHGREVEGGRHPAYQDADRR